PRARRGRAARSRVVQRLGARRRRMDARAARRRAPRMAERAAPHARSGGRHARSRLPRVARRVGVPRHPRRRLGGLRPLRDALVLAIATIRPPRTAFLWGWASGTVFFLVLLRWLQYTFQVYSAIPWPLVYGPVFLLAAYCGFWTGAVAWAVSWLTARRSAALALGLAPFLWVAAEWLRGHLFGGFPWGALGYSQYLHLRVIQIAELSGVHGVSFLLLAVRAALAGCVVLGWPQGLVGTWR